MSAYALLIGPVVWLASLAIVGELVRRAPLIDDFAAWLEAPDVDEENDPDACGGAVGVVSGSNPVWEDAS